MSSIKSQQDQYSVSQLIDFGLAPRLAQAWEGKTYDINQLINLINAQQLVIEDLASRVSTLENP